MIAKMPTHGGLRLPARDRAAVRVPRQRLSYAGNFLNMMWKTTELSVRAEPHPRARAGRPVHPARRPRAELLRDADARGRVARTPTPTRRSPRRSAALYGPLHGGANEMVLRMLREIGSKDAIPAYIERVKAGEFRLMGFGHRIYKNFDPRAEIIKQVADDVFEVTGPNPLLDIALELERIALEDEYFVSHKLYPNVDFYSGIIYQAMGFPSRCSRCSSRSAAPPGGWPSGRRASSIPSRRSRAHGSCTPAQESATTCRSRRADAARASGGLAADRRRRTTAGPVAPRRGRQVKTCRGPGNLPAPLISVAPVASYFRMPRSSNACCATSCGIVAVQRAAPSRRSPRPRS